MSPEERQLLQGVFDRMRDNASAYRDGEADRLIADNVRQQPYAPYFLTQAVIVQEQALQAANARIKDLEQQAQHAQAPSGGGGFLSSIFGGGASQAPQGQRPPVWNQGGGQPGYAPQPQQGGPWGGQQGGMMGGGMMGGGAPQGGGFLRGALTTAAGVAGGALLFDGIKGLMGGGHNSSLGIGAGVPGVDPAMGGGDTVINNYYGDSSGGDGGDNSAGWDPGPGDVADNSDGWDPGSGGGSDDSWNA